MTKRVVVATISGLFCGLFCITADIEAGLAKNISEQLPLPAIGEILANRTLIGFVIGISCLVMRHWSLHGIVIGFLVSIPEVVPILRTATLRQQESAPGSTTAF